MRTASSMSNPSSSAVSGPDVDRAAVLMDKLLPAISNKRARFVIFDVTGIELVDTPTASHLIHLAQSAHLIGASAIFTGIQPTVAQTLTQLGTDLYNAKDVA